MEFKKVEQEEIEQWKARHGQITCISVEDRDYYFKQPNRVIVKNANAKLAATKSVEDYVDVLINNCILNGKEYLDNSDEDYFSILPLVQELIPAKEATLKKALEAAEITSDTNFVRKFDAALQYYYNWKPDYINSLDDNEWAKAIQDLIWIRKEEKNKQDALNNIRGKQKQR